ncbi:MAG: rod shape-determining protein MreD [Salinivirgaceae bacterium]|nr:rod shape-determining protein MreD [Salinivirgaceae bacterium]
MFVVLVLLQVGVLNQVQLGGFINPYIYILFIILLPVGTPGWLTLVLSFVLGISIDMFCNSPGIHTSATVFAGFVRPYLLSSLMPRETVEPTDTPNIRLFGTGWFLKYCLVMVIVHHVSLFMVEAFKFSSLHLILWRALLSIVFTMILIVLSQFLFTRNNK